jgi:hypothetical protein
MLRHSIRNKHSATPSAGAVARPAPPAAPASSLSCKASAPAASNDDCNVAAPTVVETATALSAPAGAGCLPAPPVPPSPHRFTAAYPLYLRSAPSSASSSSSSFSRRSDASPPTPVSPPLSPGTSWLSCYDEVWEDGTGAELSGLSETRGIIDYYYVQDEVHVILPCDDEAEDESSLRQEEGMVPSEEQTAEATVDTDRFPREWFEPCHRLVKEECICDDEEADRQEEEQYARRRHEQPLHQLITVSTRPALLSCCSRTCFSSLTLWPSVSVFPCCWSGGG